MYTQTGKARRPYVAMATTKVLGKVVGGGRMLSDIPGSCESCVSGIAVLECMEIIDCRLAKGWQ